MIDNWIQEAQLEVLTGSITVGQFLEEDRLHSLSHTSCANNRLIRCSICKSMEKSTYYLCKFGRHVICENCQGNGNGSDINRDIDGDYIPEKECVPTGKKESSHVNNSELKLQDLASGDHIEAVKSLQITKCTKGLKKANILTTSTPKHLHSKPNIDTMVVYKNERFHDSKSSVDSIEVSTKYEVCKKEQNYERVPRPVACPVTHCAKMVTIDSISQHFNFDHSKVPRMILNKTGPQEISLNHTSLSTETKCIASFIISQNKRPRHIALKQTAFSNLDMSSYLLLLMAAKMPTIPIQLSDIKCLSRVSTRNSYTQTADRQKQNEQYYRQSISKSSSENTIWMNKSKDDIDDDEVILLWLCKLDDKNRTYTITVSGEDKKQAYSYIGDAVHIRNEHDPFSIYNRTQCLSVRKTAINKLLATANELKVTISTVL